MTDITIDKSFTTDGTSSALAAVYYSTDERKIFFEFLSGTVAGYGSVPEDIYTALESLNSNRIETGDEGSSVGGYYNRFFRETGYFPGVETADLNFVAPEKESSGLSTEEQSLVDAITNAGGPVEATNVFVAPLDEFAQDVANLPSVLRRFGVAFIHNADQEITFNVHATDEEDALVRLNKATELLGWTVKVVSITRYFN